MQLAFVMGPKTAGGCTPPGAPRGFNRAPLNIQRPSWIFGIQFKNGTTCSQAYFSEFNLRALSAVSNAHTSPLRFYFGK